MNTIFTTLRQCYGKSITVAGHSPVSIQFVTKDMFNSGQWERIGNEEILINNELLPHRESKAKGWVEAKVIGSGIMAKFLNAFYWFTCMKCMTLSIIKNYYCQTVSVLSAPNKALKNRFATSCLHLDRLRRRLSSALYVKDESPLSTD